MEPREGGAGPAALETLVGAAMARRQLSAYFTRRKRLRDDPRGFSFF